MRLTQLQIGHFRNIENTTLHCHPAINIITGDNAAGKTSVLEAIFYLGHVRSFRTPNVTELIKRDADYLQITASLSENGQVIPVGIRRNRHKTRIRINRQAVKRVSELAACIPVLAIHPDSYRLITGSPGQRRQYMDWGVFHVEHGFFQDWQRYRKALMQRNAALKSRQRQAYCQLWDQELVLHAERIDQQRRRYIDELQDYFQVLADRFFTGDKVHIDYKRGWTQGESLDNVLDQGFEHDKSRGYTGHGPHRAEIRIRVNGQSAQTGISRGQQKTLVALLRLAQAQHYTEKKNHHCILLYDDLAAELDQQHRQQILQVLHGMRIQLFLTAIERRQIDGSAWSEAAMFHVEHGHIKRTR